MRCAPRAGGVKPSIALPGAIRDPWEGKEPIQLPAHPCGSSTALRSLSTSPRRAQPFVSPPHLAAHKLARALREDEELLLLC